jgi:hypothetical protein
MTPQVFNMCAFAGSGLLAIWVFVRLPRLRPASFRAAIVHVAVSYAVFNLAPYLIPLCGHAGPPAVGVALAVAAVVLPALCYMYVSWIWLLGLIAKRLSGGPRGGHLVRSGA